MNEKQVLENFIKRKDLENCSDLKKAMVEAIAILDNDLYVSRAVNAKTCLTDALDEYGWPDEEKL